MRRLCKHTGRLVDSYRIKNKSAQMQRASVWRYKCQAPALGTLYLQQQY